MGNLDFHYWRVTVIKLHKYFGPNMQINPLHKRRTVQLLIVPIKTPVKAQNTFQLDFTHSRVRKLTI